MWNLLKSTWKEWREDEASQLAAALSYYAVVSIAPLLVLVVVVAGTLLGRQAAQDQLVTQLRGIMGSNAAQFLETIIVNAGQPAFGSAVGILSFLTLVWGSTGLFAQLQNSIDKIWNVKKQQGGSFLVAVRNRMIAFAMVMGVVILLLASFFLTALLSAAASWGSNLLPGSERVWHAGNFLVSFALLLLLFAVVFKVLPHVKTAWRDVWLGAAVAALLFTGGNFILGFYLANAGSAYGAAGSVVVFLLWVFYSAQIVFLGAEFAQVYARQHGRGFEVEPGAVRTTESLPTGTQQ